MANQGSPVLLWHSKIFQFPTGLSSFNSLTPEFQNSIKENFSKINAYIQFYTADSDITVDNPIKIEIIGSESNNPNPDYKFVAQAINNNDLYNNTLAGLRAKMIENLLTTSNPNLSNYYIRQGITNNLIKIEKKALGGTVVFDSEKYYAELESNTPYVQSVLNDQYVEIRITYDPPTGMPTTACSSQTPIKSNSETPPPNYISEVNRLPFPPDYIEGVYGLVFDPLNIPDSYKITMYDDAFSPTKTIYVPLFTTYFFGLEGFSSRLLQPYNTTNPNSIGQIGRPEILNPDIPEELTPITEEKIENRIKNNTENWIKRIKELIEAYNNAPTNLVWSWQKIIHTSNVVDMKAELINEYPEFENTINNNSYFQQHHANIPVFYYNRDKFISRFNQINASLITSSPRELYMFDRPAINPSNNQPYQNYKSPIADSINQGRFYLRIGNFGVYDGYDEDKITNTKIWIRKNLNDKHIEIIGYSVTSKTKYKYVPTCHSQTLNPNRVVKRAREALGLSYGSTTES